MFLGVGIWTKGGQVDCAVCIDLFMILSDS